MVACCVTPTKLNYIHSSTIHATASKMRLFTSVSLLVLSNLNQRSCEETYCILVESHMEQYHLANAHCHHVSRHHAKSHIDEKKSNVIHIPTFANNLHLEREFSCHLLIVHLQKKTKISVCTDELVAEEIKDWLLLYPVFNPFLPIVIS